MRSRSAVGAMPVPMVDRWFAWRDRVLASARFQRWAAAFPLTRPVARRRISRPLRSVRRLRLFAGAVCLRALAALRFAAGGTARRHATCRRYLGLSPDATERLLAAAAALGLVERRALGRFGLGPLGAAMADQPAIAALVEHHAKLYADLADPVGLLRGDVGDTALGGYWPYARSAGRECPCDETAPLQPIDVALAILDRRRSARRGLAGVASLPSRRRGRRGGLSGGRGAANARTFACSSSNCPRWRRAPRLASPPPACGGRVDVVGGNFHVDPLPIGADVISLVRVLHDHDDAAASALLRAVRRALPRGGKLLLAEPMAETPGAEPAGDAYFGFYLLAMGSGRPRSAQCLKEMLEAAGFSQVRHWPTRLPLLVRALSATA